MLVPDFGGMITKITTAATGSIEVVMDRATVESVRTHLVDARQLLTEAQASMGSIPASVVGGSPYAEQLVQHSKLANTHLLDSIAQINIGLENYDAAMGASLRDIEGTEDLIVTDLARGHTNIGAGTSPTGQG